MTNNKIPQRPESLFPPLLQCDGTPRFLRGEESHLQPLRSFNAPVCTTNSASENDGGDNETEETTLCNVNPISATIQNTSGAFDDISGQIFVTTKRVLFVAKSQGDIAKDFSIDAQCISLHAMMSDPKPSVYCQLADECSDNDDDEENNGPTEIFFYPQISDETDSMDTDDEKKEFCKLLFDSLSKLINLNPILDDEDDGGAMGGLGAMLGMIANSSYADDNDNDNDEMICRIDPSQMVTAWDEKSQEGQVASSDERNRMLERLDNMLVVPSEYEVDGQFDDAEEEYDNNGDEEMDRDIL